MENSKISLSPVVNYYHNRENEWTTLVNKHIPGAKLLRWGADHRVFKYKKRVYKIEKSSFGKENPEESILNEYKIITNSKILIKDLKPNFYQIENLWDVLELDFINGFYLEDLLNNNELKNSISISKLIIKVFLISLSGIFYRQLRSRHILLKGNGKIVFIDFGNSKKINFIAALVLNLSPIIKINSRWQLGRLVSLSYEILRLRIQGERKLRLNETEIMIQRLGQNFSRSNKELPINIKTQFGDENAFKNFTAMEEKMFKAIKKNPMVAFDAIQFNFSGYGVIAKRDWGFIWDTIRQKINFNDKKVIDLGSGMGGVGAFARMEGASLVISYENTQTLLDASKFCSQALGYFDNVYHLISFNSFIKGDFKIDDGDIIFALSKRLEGYDQNTLIKSISRYSKILFLTTNPKYASNELNKYGSFKTELLLKIDATNFIIHAFK